MSSLIANKVRIYSVLCHCFQLMQLQQQLLVRYSSLLTICLQAANISNHDCSLHARLHTRLTALQPLVACFILRFYSPTQKVWQTFLKRNVHVLAFSRTLSQLHCSLCILYIKNKLGQLHRTVYTNKNMYAYTEIQWNLKTKLEKWKFNNH